MKENFNEKEMQNDFSVLKFLRNYRKIERYLKNSRRWPVKTFFQFMKDFASKFGYYRSVINIINF